MYRKISKWIFWVLALVSVAIMIWGSATGFTSNDAVAVDVLLRWGYVLMGAALCLVVLLGIVMGGIADPKSLKNLGLGLLVMAVLGCVAYFTASDAPLVGYNREQPDAQTLKITDTLIKLVYLLGAGAVISIFVGEIISVIRNK